jgi:hypothetical protein
LIMMWRSAAPSPRTMTGPDAFVVVSATDAAAAEGCSDSGVSSMTLEISTGASVRTARPA